MHALWHVLQHAAEDHSTASLTFNQHIMQFELMKKRSMPTAPMQRFTTNRRSNAIRSISWITKNRLECRWLDCLAMSHIGNFHASTFKQILQSRTCVELGSCANPEWLEQPTFLRLWHNVVIDYLLTSDRDFKIIERAVRKTSATL